MNAIETTQATRCFAEIEHYKEVARQAISYAIELGCDQARAGISHIEMFNLDTHNHQIESLQQSTALSLTLHLYVDGRYGNILTNRLDDPDELQHFIRQGIATTRYLSPDVHRTLPNPARYYHKQPDEPSFHNCDASMSDVSTQTKIDLALQVAKQISQADTEVPIISLETSIIDRLAWEYICDSQGFEGYSELSLVYLSGGITLKGKDNDRVSSYWSHVATGYKDLKTDDIMHTALERALRKCDPHPVESGSYTIIVESQQISKFIEPLLDSLYGSSIDTKQSFLIDKLGQSIASKKLTIYDNPWREGALSATRYDAEGVRTQPTDIISEGVLQTYFIDTYYGHKLQMAPTLAAPQVICIQPGERTLRDILASKDRAILITGFNGGNTNDVTGDFSFGIEGILYVEGQPVQAISEMNVTGNFLELWQNLAEVASDVDPTTSDYYVPMVFENVTCNGL